MRTLDRYIIRNFLYSYMLCFVVMMGLRIVADLFVNVDEFAELDLGTLDLVGYIGRFYMYNSLVYFHELGGVILVAAAAFSLARMNHANELVAVMASGQSLYRVILPVVMIAMVLAVLGGVNEEVLIPQARGELLRDRDEGEAERVLPVQVILDSDRTAWYSRKFDRQTERMSRPLLIYRDPRAKQVATVSGRDAWWLGDDRWRITSGSVAVLTRADRQVGGSSAFVWSRVTPGDIAQGLDGAEAGVRISAERVDLAGEALIAPRFEVLSPNAADLVGDRRRVIATLAAARAWYGPAGERSEQMGYHLQGDPTLDATDVADWSALCQMLSQGSAFADDDPIRRLWAMMSADVRADVEALADPKATGRADQTGRILAELNRGLDRRDFFVAGDFAAIDRPISPADRRAIAGDRSAVDPATVRRLNRLVLDDAFDGALVRCGGDVLVDSDLSPREIVLRQAGERMEFMSSGEINALLATGRVPDVNTARLIKHLRFTTPIATVIMLLLGMPFIVSRERNIKASAMVCVLVVGTFHMFIFLSRYVGQDLFEYAAGCLADYGASDISPQWGPILGAWLPILIFAPVAALLLDSMETMTTAPDRETLATMLILPVGRIGRGAYWLKGMVPLTVVVFAGWLIDQFAIGRPGLIFWTLSLLCAWPMLAMNIKRCHDRGRTGWFMVILAVPVVGWLWYLIEVSLAKGQEGLNSFGADPAAVIGPVSAAA